MIINNCGVFSNIGLRTLVGLGSIMSWRTTLNAGIIYAPYIPLTLENAVSIDEINTIASRYAIKIVNNSYYGTISLPNINREFV